MVGKDKNRTHWGRCVIAERNWHKYKRLHQQHYCTDRRLYCSKVFISPKATRIMWYSHWISKKNNLTDTCSSRQWSKTPRGLCEVLRTRHFLHVCISALWSWTDWLRKAPFFSLGRAAGAAEHSSLQRQHLISTLGQQVQQFPVNTLHLTETGSCLRKDALMFR